MEEKPPEPAPPVPAVPKPTREERMAKINETQKGRGRRGFLIGLLAGQVLIVAMDFGGELLIHLLRDKVTFNAPIPLRAVVFIGMTAGIVMTGLLILFILGLQGAGYVVGKKKVGFFTAVGRGMKRLWKAAWAVGLTLSVVGGTAWFLIPRKEWKPTAEWMQDKGDKAYQGAKGVVEKVIKPSPPKSP